VSEDLYLFVQGTDHQLWHKGAGSVGRTGVTSAESPPRRRPLPHRLQSSPQRQPHSVRQHHWREPLG
jgi:hypothetical protein